MKTTLTVDEVGRLVLPKNIRAAIGITGRMKGNVEVAHVVHSKDAAPDLVIRGL